MNIERYLTITDAQVQREISTNDSMGGITTVTAYTTITACQIWENGMGTRSWRDTNGGSQFISSHLMILKPESYTFTLDDHFVIWNGNTYSVKSLPFTTKDVWGNNAYTMIALDLIK